MGVLPSKSYEVSGLKFRTVPMYNTGKRFHKKENDWVGYIFYIDGAAYYFAGDTDLIPEMEEIQADVAFLPVGGTYTMTADEAVRAAGIIKPRIAVPMHYADVAGTEEDADYFIRNLDSAIEGVLIKG
jgi:L-ascorbate metabolism protein UlaG (beta-lactamase superfamily)